MQEISATLLDKAIALAKVKGVTVQEALYALHLEQTLIQSEAINKFAEVLVQLAPKVPTEEEQNFDTPIHSL